MIAYLKKREEMSLSVFSRVIQLQWHHRSTVVFIYPCLCAYVPILFFPFNFHPHRPARGGDTASFQVKFSISVHLRFAGLRNLNAIQKQSSLICPLMSRPRRVSWLFVTSAREVVANSSCLPLLERASPSTHLASLPCDHSVMPYH